MAKGDVAQRIEPSNNFNPQPMTIAPSSMQQGQMNTGNPLPRMGNEVTGGGFTGMGPSQMPQVGPSTEYLQKMFPNSSFNPFAQQSPINQEPVMRPGVQQMRMKQ